MSISLLKAGQFKSPTYIILMILVVFHFNFAKSFGPTQAYRSKDSSVIQYISSY